MTLNSIKKIINEFVCDGKPILYKLLNDGLINSTYLIELNNQEKYILQRINENVFKEPNKLMENINLVTNYIKSNNGITVEFIKTKNGNFLTNDNWRLMKYIDNTICISKKDNIDKKIIYEAGKAIGDFEKKLNNFDAKKIHNINPNFHNIKYHIKNLYKAINNKNIQKDRYNKAKECIEFACDENRINKAQIILTKLENNLIPLRVTHNDTKLANILFDKDNKEYVSLIDLDTILPGTILYDFGDGARSCMQLNDKDYLNTYEHFLKGFLDLTADILTNEEKTMLPLSIWTMSYKNFINYLTDYLNGDIYFLVDKNIPDFNLNKAINRMNFIKELEKIENDLIQITNNAIH